MTRMLLSSTIHMQIEVCVTSYSLPRPFTIQKLCLNVVSLLCIPVPLHTFVPRLPPQHIVINETNGQRNERGQGSRRVKASFVQCNTQLCPAHFFYSSPAPHLKDLQPHSLHKSLLLTTRSNNLFILIINAS